MGKRKGIIYEAIERPSTKMAIGTSRFEQNKSTGSRESRSGRSHLAGSFSRHSQCLPAAHHAVYSVGQGNLCYFAAWSCSMIEQRNR
jgi:hypothetical protein